MRGGVPMGFLLKGGDDLRVRETGLGPREDGTEVW